MKIKNISLSILCLLVLTIQIVCPFIPLPTVYATPASNEDRGLAFVFDVLPFDTSKYTIITSTRYGEESFDYTFASSESTIVVHCSFKNNVLSNCMVRSSSERVFYESYSENLIESARRFIEKYQTFTKEDLSDMLNALSKVDSTKNVTATSGNIKMQISNCKLGISDVTVFRWAVTINGVEYSSIELEYRDGVFKSFNDNRENSKIGNTDVTISQEQAVELALQYVETYSYKALAGSRDDPYYVDVTGFNVSMARISCKLIPYPDESAVLGPCWSVQLPVEGDYVGLWALSVFVHAGSGKILQCQPLIIAMVGSWAEAGTETKSSDRGALSSSTNGGTKTNGDATLYPNNGSTLSGSVSDEQTSAEQVTVTSTNLGIITLIIIALIAVPAGIFLTVKRKDKK